MRPFLAIAPVVLASLAVAACQQNVAVAPTIACDFTPLLTTGGQGPVLVPRVSGTLQPVPLNTVSITDVGITNKVLVRTTSARRTETGTIAVVANLVNCTDVPLQVEGRTQFLAADQSPVEGASAWLRVFLPARSLGTYATSSTSPAADSFLIELREGV